MTSYYGPTPSPSQGFIPMAPGERPHTPVIPSPMHQQQAWHPGGAQYVNAGGGGGGGGGGGAEWMGFGDASHQQAYPPQAYPQWMLQAQQAQQQAQQQQQQQQQQQRPSHAHRPSFEQVPQQGMFPPHPWGGTPGMGGMMPMAPAAGGWGAPAGPPPGHTPMTGMMHPGMLAGTPMMYPGMPIFYPSPTGMMPQNLEEPNGMAGFRHSNRPKAGRSDEGVFVDKWQAGPHYGPTLNRSLIKLLKVQPEINPILLPPSARHGAEGPYLEWNMLFPDQHIHLSTDPEHLSWNSGRKSPATFPRTDTLTIVSPYFGWSHTIKHKSAITCNVLLSEIYKFLHSFTAPAEYGALPPQVQQQIYASYQSNRSRNSPNVPGGNLPAQMLKIDFLRNNTMFEGIAMDHNFGVDRLGFRFGGKGKKGKGGGGGGATGASEADNCVLVLLCGPRHVAGPGGANTPSGTPATADAVLPSGMTMPPSA